MSIIARFLTVIKETELKLARNLTAMAVADGHMNLDFPKMLKEKELRTYKRFC